MVDHSEHVIDILEIILVTRGLGAAEVEWAKRRANQGYWGGFKSVCGLASGGGPSGRIAVVEMDLEEEADAEAELWQHRHPDAD